MRHQTHLQQTGGRGGRNCCSRLHGGGWAWLANQPVAWLAATLRTGTVGRGDEQR